MRIVIAHSHLNTLGGGERTALELSRRLSARHEVTLWAGGYQPGATFPELADFPRRDLTTREWLTARPEAEAVVTHTFGANLLALRHPHTICYIHSVRSVYARGGSRPDLIARRLLERRALSRAATVLTNSRYSADRLQALHGVHAEVLYPGVDDALRAIDSPPGSYALYAGRLAPEKGIERLFAWHAGTRIPLVVAGAGDPAYVQHLRRLAPDETRFTGARTGAALAQLYAEARYFAFTPHDEELGLAAMEAMAAGKPVIATAEGGLPEIVRDGATGFLVQTRERYRAAARALVESDSLCVQLGSAAREAVASATWDVYARRIETLCLVAGA